MAIVKVNAIKMRSFKAELKKIIKKYDRAIVVFSDYDSDLRKRLIKADGTCTVAYKGRRYKKWSKYQESCFMDYCCSSYYGNRRNKVNKSLDRTIQEMIEHDKYEPIRPLEIKYGKDLKRTLYVVGA